MRRVMTPDQKDQLRQLASEATRGRILCFGRWMADFGNPIDWHRDPTNENRWPASAHWSKVLGRGRQAGDVKFTWEAARFPQAYTMARAATLDPLAAPYLAAVLTAQIESFIRNNPLDRGVHWASGQETAIRLCAWLFGIQVFSAFGLIPDAVISEVGQNLFASGAHIASHIEYARDSVSNNHLLSEALGLFATGRLLPGRVARRWRDLGFDLLVEQAGRQIYPDGSNLQQSHVYHRGVMQTYLWATALVRANSEEPPQAWLSAMERSLDFLWSHQNDEDGRLPNYGPNDGSLPFMVATDDFTDFRPVLQSLSIATRGERLYEPGPWDEMGAWFFGADIMWLPVRPRTRTSVSFAHTGHHVLRGKSQDSFCAFRCGTVIARFSQIDMLHLDVWWRGQNVLVDAGTYLYNGPPHWHRHFFATESHNTVQVDGRDQMLHFRQFKTLFPTEAKLLRFEDAPDRAVCEGEHYGYIRTAKCIHRRAVLFVKDDLWVVADTITGEGSHGARLHWLAGDYPFSFDATDASLRLETPEGLFSITVLDEGGNPCVSAAVVSGQEKPARGWQSRYYGEKIPVPSMAVECCGPLPVSFVTLLGAGHPKAFVRAGEWEVSSKDTSLRFTIEAGSFHGLSVARIPVPELQT